MLYISRYFEDNRAEYYDRLQGVRERGEIQEWLQLFLTAVAVQARDAVDRAEALVDLRERYRQALRGSRSRAPEVVDLLLGNPVLTTGRVERELAVTNAGALNLIRQLESLEVVQDVGRTGRGGRRVWVAHDVLTALEGRSGDDQSAPDDHDVTLREDAQ